MNRTERLALILEHENDTLWNDWYEPADVHAITKVEWSRNQCQRARQGQRNRYHGNVQTVKGESRTYWISSTTADGLYIVHAVTISGKRDRVLDNLDYSTPPQKSEGINWKMFRASEQLEKCGAEDDSGAWCSKNVVHTCRAIDDHSGQHKCLCGYQWGARSDGY